MRRRLRTFLDRILGRQSSQPPRPTKPTTRPSTPSTSGRSRPTDALEHHGLSDTDIRRVDVSYEPSSDGDPDPGEVVWAWVAFEEDPNQGKDRPVVVIGRTGAYLAGVALTSKAGNPEYNLSMGTGSWDREGRQSFAKLDRVLRIDPAHVRREGAILDKPRFERLVDALRRAR